MADQEIKNEIIYFPYLFLREDEIDFGFAKVIRLESDLSKYCSDEGKIAHVRNLLSAFYEGKERPIRGIGLLKFAECELFDPVPNLTTDRIDEIKNLLFISALSLSNTSDRNSYAGWSVVASDNFDYFIQPFVVGAYSFGSENGYIVTKIVGGYKVGGKYFKIPEYILEPRYNLDTDLLNELLWLRQYSPVIYKRINRAIHFVYQSSSNNPRFSVNSRILLMATSFEILLKLPEKQQRKYFREMVGKLAKSKKDRTIRFWSSRAPYNKSNRKTGSDQVWWADNFYTLRNKIAHGDNLKPSDYIFRNTHRHFDISIIMFLLLLKRLINKRRKKKIFFDIIWWGGHSDGEEKFLGFRYDHQIIEKLISDAYFEQTSK